MRSHRTLAFGALFLMALVVSGGIWLIDELNRISLHDELGVVRAKFCRREPREPRLIVGRVVCESQRERLDPTFHTLAHERYDQSRVDTSRQESPQRNISDQTPTNRVAQ